MFNCLRLAIAGRATASARAPFTARLRFAADSMPPLAAIYALALADDAIGLAFGKVFMID